MDERLEAILRKHDIDPAVVIDVTVLSEAAFMWRTKAAWPAGGTYEAQMPRESGDEMVAQKVDTTVTVEIVGHRDGFAMLPVSAGDLERSRGTFVDRGTWAFKE